MFWNKKKKLGDRPAERMTVGKFIWACYYAMKDRQNMEAYLWEHSGCDPVQPPSKSLRRRYGLTNDNASIEVWGILEKHFEREGKPEPEPEETKTVTEQFLKNSKIPRDRAKEV